MSLRRFPVLALLACLLGALPAASVAENPPAHSSSALMLSDLHFDPFSDPAKVAQLDAAPVSDWQRIFAAPDAADRADRFAALNESCHMHGEDTSYALLHSTLAAIHQQGGSVRYVTVSGDFLAHNFRCRYSKLLPASRNYAAFTAKTILFLMDQLRTALPGKPVYAALGNNDSDCEDYQLDVASPFFAALAESFLADVPQTERAAAEASFKETGSYAVTLPAPLEHARLLVVDDLYLSSKYSTCGGKRESAGSGNLLSWLQGELAEAAKHHENLWVMAHIPPGIDPYSTIFKMRDICSGAHAELFLSDDKLTDTLTAASSSIRLVVLAHTHLDELRLLHDDRQQHEVAAKLVPSISPIHGNRPSFVVASVDNRTATLRDYRVIALGSLDDPSAAWKESYRFDALYHQTNFDAPALHRLMHSFLSEPDGAASQSYLSHMQAGVATSPLTLFWSKYACAMTNTTEAGYRACTCPAKK